MADTPYDFVTKWRGCELKERSASQEHFLDLCRLVGHPTPAQVDLTGESFTFEKGASKATGGDGFADVWKKGYFAWEYKGMHADLEKAYRQVLQYREALENPPLLIVSDLQRIVVHTNFTNTTKRTVEIALDDLLTVQGLDRLKDIFYQPEAFRSTTTTEQVTTEAAEQFAKLADMLRERGEEPHRAAHFLIRLLFCLFAEDAGLLPQGLFTKLVTALRGQPAKFSAALGSLFQVMSTGGMFGVETIRHFNGGLFNDAEVVELDAEAMRILERVGSIDWSSIEPAVLGTLFERSLDPSKRSQLGAFYTSREDILLIVEPVLMAPLRRRWDEVREKSADLVKARDEADSKRVKDNRHKELAQLLTSFSAEISKTTVLDPACGSGNFLYVALRQLLDLEKEVIAHAHAVGVGSFLPHVSPRQLFGIEINPYAHELAQATIWIGYIQWLRENGFGVPAEPILQPLDTIREGDAVLEFDAEGAPEETIWPTADVIVGNPPFLGWNKLRQELGDKTVEALFKLYDGRVPAFADLVCYWFDKAFRMIESRRAKRAGLLGTQSIRFGANRQVLDRISEQGAIFWAQADRDWVLNGAAVHVSMVGFDGGSETMRILDGESVAGINADLTGGTDVTQAVRLQENIGLAYIGDMKKGRFDITADQAQRMIRLGGNPNGRSNADVIRPWVNGLDLTRRPRDMWIIDFGLDMPQSEAAAYEAPFEYVRQNVKPERDKVRNNIEREKWWIHGRPAPEMRMAIARLDRFIATPRVAKHRLFLFLPAETLADGQVIVFARNDYYAFGVLQSTVHELWARAKGTQLREAESGSRYSLSMTIDTFPFPWTLGQEVWDDSKLISIAEAAHSLEEKRDRWLNPEGATEAELKKRTLTNLYNQRPTWLDLAHKRLDEAVFAAYGWPSDLSDDEILARLLELNHERAGVLHGEPS